MQLFRSIFVLRMLGVIAPLSLSVSINALTTTAVTVPNYSFESGTANWTGAQLSTYAPTTSYYAAGGQTGSRVASVYSPGTSKASYLTSTGSLGKIAASTTYTLSVSVGHPLDNSSDNVNSSNSYVSANIALLANGVLIPAANLTGIGPSKGSWGNYVVSFKTAASDPLVGQALSIRLGQDAGAPAGTTPTPNFDNVRLIYGSNLVHPGISHTLADLNRMKNNINVEPYKTAYLAFSSNSYSSYLNTGQGAVTAETYGVGQFQIRNDAQVAHYNAVMWYMTGNQAYLTNAITIMMGWANTLTSFDITDHITAGTAAVDFCNAVEILKATSNGAWTAANDAAFRTWMLAYLFPPLLTPGNTMNPATAVLEAAGHGGLQMEGLFAIAIMCDRQDIFNFAVSSITHNGTYTYGLQEYVNSSGQNYETARDQGHAAGNIGTFAHSFYMAWNQGSDLYSTGNNLLATATESQAKIDLLYNVNPVTWTAADGSGHNSINPSSRSPFDNLGPDTAYYIFHTVKGLNMPYTSLSANTQFPISGTSFMYRVDSSGQVPTVPLTGFPAPVDVVLCADGYFSGGYLAHFGPGSYTTAQLNTGGVIGGPWGNGGGTLSSLEIPAGWTVTLYSGDNFTGNSVALTSTTSDLSTIGWNDGMYSATITAGSLPYAVSSGTYKIVNKNSGQVADVSGASLANNATIVQQPYTGALNQLWRVEALGNNQYRILNINSNRAMEANVNSNIDQLTYVPAPYLTTGGTATASADNSANGQGAAQAFDGVIASKWFDPASTTGWLQYQLATAAIANQYQITSAEDVPQRDPAAWQLLGSNNGTTWVTLDTQSAQVFANRNQTLIYNFANTTAYLYYRLNVTANAGGTGYGIQLSELALYNTQTALNQKWAFSPVMGSSFGSLFNMKIVSSGEFMDVSGSSTTKGASIIQYPGNGQANQQWSLQIP